MDRQIINMNITTPKVSIPTEKAIDVTSYKNDGSGTFDRDDGTFYIKKAETANHVVKTLAEKISGHFRFNLTLINGDSVSPSMNPTIRAFSVTMEDWGVSGHSEVDTEWEYDAETYQYIVTLSDGAVSPHGYSFFFDIESKQASETQQPNLFKESQYWTTGGDTPHYSLWLPSETPYDATVYYGVFRFKLSQDCTPGTPVVDESTAKMFNSTATSIFSTNHCDGVQWKDGWREFFLTWEEASNLDPDGYWVHYSCANSAVQQYPRRYVKQGSSSTDWFQTPDLIIPGDYYDTVIWRSMRHVYQEVSPDTVLLEEQASHCFNMVGGTFIRDVAGTTYSPGYPGSTGLYTLIYTPDGGGYYHYLIIKCSVDYQIVYSVVDTMEIGLFESPVCNQESATVFVETDDIGLTYYAKNHEPAASRPIHYRNFDGGCTEQNHFVSSFFKETHNPGMHFAVASRFVATINYVKLV